MTYTDATPEVLAGLVGKEVELLSAWDTPLRGTVVTTDLPYSVLHEVVGYRLAVPLPNQGPTYPVMIFTSDMVREVAEAVGV